MTPLSISQQLNGKKILIFGGTGFLGKVCLSLLLHNFDMIEHIYLIVRARRDKNNQLQQSSSQRFWKEIITSAAFDSIRKKRSESTFTGFIKKKITVLNGDVTCEFAGIPTEVRDILRGKVDVLLNVSGIVDFNPPLDRSLEVNAFGMQNLVALAKDLGHIKMLHTSTCYVAGARTGQVDEIDPLQFPFPRADELHPKHWDPQREIQECTEMIQHAQKRATNAFRQSEFLADARKKLQKKGEPTRGSALEDELDKVQRRYVEGLLVNEGTERAQFWGWHNIYTYTKSIGEQILCNSGLDHSIVRPAVIESALSFPHIGWNEGINTSAPLIYLCNQGPLGVPTTKDSVLDIIPVDLVATGILIALGELLEGQHKAVYQLGTSDSAPLKMSRLIELVSLQKRIYQRKNASNPITAFVQQRIETLPVSVSQYQEKGPRKTAKTFRWARKALKPLEKSPLSSLIKPATKALESGAKGLEITAKIIDQFLPFTATHNYRFSCAHTRQAFERLSTKEQQLLPWYPEKIDWRHYFLDVHCPGLREHVFPLIEEKKNKLSTALRSYDHLLDMLDEIAERFDHLPALLQTQEDGFASLSYRQLRDLAYCVAQNLRAAGVSPGDRVLLSAQNHPYWAVCYFGVLLLGAIVVPLDVALDSAQAESIELSSQANCAILDGEANEKFGRALELSILAMDKLVTPPEESPLPLPKIGVNGDTLASILYTSGTTGHPKGVMLSHGNFTSMLASLARIFPLSEKDRVLSVLPLHHTFEFSCGLLLPLSQGARIIYLDELSSERIRYGLREGKVTGMVGVPALWQLLERSIQNQIRDRGPIFEMLIDSAMEFNRSIGKTTGMDIGALLFSPIHAKMGGRIRFLISGGAALPKETHQFFSGLGLFLTEGYGLTEAAPVLSVSSGGPKSKAGTVGKAIPGVEIKIINPDKKGIGEVLARGPNVMQGYYLNSEATQKSLDDDGWLHTGDMGKLDAKNRLILAGRAKEVVVTAAGENIYLDDVEQRLGTIRYIKEFVLVGLENPQGGERLGMLAVLDNESDMEKALLHNKAMESLREAIEKLPYIQRPTIYHLIEADLPRTRTRKIKRKESKESLLRIINALPQNSTESQDISDWIASAISSVSGMESNKINSQTRLREDLYFDSLMAVELASVLSKHQPVEAQQIEKSETVAEIIQLMKLPQKRAEAPQESKEIIVPPLLRVGMKELLTKAQHQLYNTLLKTKITGRANIPQNRQVLVISNHCSHLDMGLVKYALGPYGRKLTALAAQDYFFEGNKWKVAYFSQLTNLRPIDRKKGYRASIKQAKEIIDQGHVALIFPEGTRQPDGKIDDFKPMFGQIALESNVDILPLHLGGTYESMPKGAFLPKTREIHVHIGPVLSINQLREAMRDKKASQVLRIIAKIAKFAIEELREGRIFQPTDKELLAFIQTLEEQKKKPQNGIQQIFNRLRRDYSPEQQQKSISWYFSLDGKEGPRYTISVKPKSLMIYAGKPTEGKADCVIKTSQELLRKMIMEAYVPQMSEFLSGRIKTNSPALLMEFQKIFKLQESH